MSRTQIDETDEALIGRVKRGEERALGLLYDRHASMVFALARTLVGDADAEEVTEDVFMRIWTDPGRFDPGRGSLKGYLATITRSRSLDRLRSRKRSRSAHQRVAVLEEADMAAGPGDPVLADQEVERSEARERVSAALETLNRDQRHAIQLAYFEGLSQSEIARRLDAPLGTVKTRIRDGMTKLRDYFQQQEARR